MSVTTFAAIDIGSYNTMIEIFELDRKNGLRSLTLVRRAVNIGRDTYVEKRISMETLAELTQILIDFKRIMKEFGVAGYRACAKSAFREAGNRYIAIEHIYHATGIQIEILSNSEQRFLGYKSIASKGEEFQKFIEKGTAIVDVGGGSIQISLFDKDALVSTSNILLGTLRIRERLSSFEHETIHYDTLVDQLIHKDLANFKKMYLKNRKIDNLILVGDYFTNLIFQNRSDQTKTESRETFMNWYQHVVSSSPKEIAAELGISSEMSTVLIPTAVLYRKLIEQLEVETIWLPGIQLTDGIAYDYGEKNRIIRSAHDFESDILMAAKNISRRYASDKKHNESLVACATSIFDTVKKSAGLDSRARLLLQVACYLHDCGKYISLVNVAECSYNIITSTEIIGISERERRIIAHIVKFNTTSFVDLADREGSTGIGHEGYMLIARLTAILRVANSLDQSYQQKIEAIDVKKKDREVIITVETGANYTLEQGIFRENVGFFEEIFNLKPVLRLKVKR